MATARRKILKIAPEMVLMLLQSLDGKGRVLCTGLPADAKFVSARMTTYPSDHFELILESASFPEVGEGCSDPYFDASEVKFTRLPDLDEPVVVQGGPS